MSDSEFGSLSLVLVALLGTAHLFGYLFTRLRQPRVVGEILAGVVLGPSAIGYLAPSLSIAKMLSGQNAANADQSALGFLFNLGLLLLMFVSGAETKNLFHRQDRRELAWLGVVGTGLPFIIAISFSPFVPLSSMMGIANQRTALLLVIGIAMAVTSIPVISRILRDLGILNTRFARLVLGVAVCEDIFLWAILALAVSLAHAAHGSATVPLIAVHTFKTVVYLALGLLVMPKVLGVLTTFKWNPFLLTSPVGYLCLILLAYAAIAAAMDVSLVFAAFLAGFALATSADSLQHAFETVGKTAFAFFIPVYFALVGCKLDLSKSFSMQMLIWFLTFACLAKLLSAGLGARLARFPWRDAVNLSIALNARGGPGIVLASVAFDAGIINRNFYTTLVLVALITSQLAGAWLEFVLRKGWPLLSCTEIPTAGEEVPLEVAA